MHKKHDLKHLIFFMGIVIGAPLAASGENFPVPKILESNVAFWKKIYTEVSTSEGLIHDYEYPLVIYKKLTVGSESSRLKSKIIDIEKGHIKALLTTITTQSDTAWTAEARDIVALFEKHASKEALAGAEERIRFQLGQKDRFKEGLYRSGAYLDTIKTILAQHNVPEQLAFLPHVESSFSPDAYSRVGAAGLWQFMRSTGRLYLKIDYTIDERRDPILSTYAAAKLLSHNFQQLQSWPLAITAYNHGLNGMKRAVAGTGSCDIAVIIQRHESKTFKFASKNFYSCFLAASAIASDPYNYFPDITFAPPLKYFDITIDYFIKPEVLASSIGIPLSQLEELNPALRAVVFSHNRLIPRGATIHIPQTVSLASVQQNLLNIPDSLKIKTPPRPEYYRVARGDNLYSIARRLGVSAQDIAIENNINRFNRIYAGQVLRIPEASALSLKGSVTEVAAAVKKDTTPVIQQPAVEKQQTIVPPKLEIIPDTIKEIIMATAESVPQQNVTPSARSGYAYKFDAEIYNFDASFSPEETRAVITISLNETIGHYAEWLAIPTQRIRQINGMGRSSYIRINQDLAIPATQETMEQFTRRRLEYHMAIEEDFYNQYKVTELKPKFIKRGETLWDICNQDGEIPLWLLKKHNKQMDITRLFPGMQIWVPVVEEKTDIDFKQETDKNWRGLFPLYLEPVPSAKPFQILY